MSIRLFCRILFLLIIITLSVFYITACSSIDELSSIEASADALPLDPAVISGVLDNGLTWYFRPNTEPANRASLRLVVNAGSILEEDDQQGLAHFCEHMAFNGTEHFAKMELVDYLESIGMSFGPEINAYTGFDETVYMLEIPVDDEEIIENAFQVLEDWAHLVSYEDEEVEKERGVIREEWRLGRGASGRILDKMIPVLFRGSAYADRLPIGQMDDVMNAPPQRLRDFYNSWYRPDLMAVVVVGDLDADYVKTLIEEYFSFSATAEPVERIESQVVFGTGTEVCMIPDPELTYSTVEISVKTERPNRRSEADYRNLLLESLSWSMFNERLGEVARKPEPPFINAGGGTGQIVRTAGNVSCYASADTDMVEEALAAIVAELERAGRFGFTEAEVNRKKADYLKSIEEYYRERDNIPSTSLASELVDYYLKDVFMPGVEAEYELYNSLIPSISLDEINEYAAVMLPDEGRTITVIFPEGASVPAESEIVRIAESGSELELETYFDDSLDRELVENPPEAGAISERITFDSIGAELWHLSNGADIVLKTTDFREDEILFSAFSRGGLSLHSDEEYLSGLYSSLILSQSGLGDFNAVQLEKKLSGLSVRLSPYLSSSFEGLSGSFSPDEIDVFMQLLYLYFTEPVFDEAVLGNLKIRLESLIENRSADPMNEYYDRVTEILTQDNYRSRPLDKQRLADIDAKLAKEVFAERFSGADDFIFVFTGNIERAALEKACIDWIAPLPAGSAGEKPVDRGGRPPAGSVRDVVYRGIEPQSRVRMTFVNKLDEWSPDIELQVETASEVLETLLRETLREDMSGTYHIAVQPAVEREPYPSADINIEFGCDPDRVDELSLRVVEVINMIASGELEEQYIIRQEQQYRRSYEKSIELNSFWLLHLEDAVGMGDDPEDILTPELFNEKITRESVIDTINSFVDTEEFISVILMPEQG